MVRSRCVSAEVAVAGDMILYPSISYRRECVEINGNNACQQPDKLEEMGIWRLIEGVWGGRVDVK